MASNVTSNDQRGVPLMSRAVQSVIHGHWVDPDLILFPCGGLDRVLAREEDLVDNTRTGGASVGR